VMQMTAQPEKLTAAQHHPKPVTEPTPQGAAGILHKYARLYTEEEREAAMFAHCAEHYGRKKTAATNGAEPRLHSPN
jgi:hypothetical protein